MSEIPLRSPSKAIETLATEPLAKKVLLLEKLVQILPQGSFTFFELNDVVDRAKSILNVKVSVNLLVSTATLIVSDDEETITSTFVIGRGLNSSIMNDFEDLLCRMESGKFCSCHQIIEELDNIKSKPYYYSPVGDVVVFALLGASIPMFLIGGPHDVWVAAILGGLVGLFNILPMKIPSFAPLVDFTSTFVASLIGMVFVKHSGLDLHFLPIWLGAIILPIPGFSLAMGFLEIACGHAVQGTSQIFRSVTCASSMALATILGMYITSPSLNSVSEFACNVQMPLYIVFIGCFLFAVSVGLLMHARLSQIPLIVFASMLMAVGNRFWDHFTAIHFLGPFLLYILCQISAPFTRQHPFISFFVCVLPFCPGSAFARGLIFIFEGSKKDGKEQEIAYKLGTAKLIQALFDVLAISFAMIAGRFLCLPMVTRIRKLMYCKSSTSNQA